MQQHLTRKQVKTILTNGEVSYQSFGMFPGYRMRSNMHAAIHHAREKDIADATEDLIESLGMEDFDLAESVASRWLSSMGYAESGSADQDDQRITWICVGGFVFTPEEGGTMRSIVQTQDSITTIRNALKQCIGVQAEAHCIVCPQSVTFKQLGACGPAISRHIANAADHYFHSPIFDENDGTSIFARLIYTVPPKVGHVIDPVALRAHGYNPLVSEPGFYQVIPFVVIVRAAADQFELINRASCIVESRGNRVPKINTLVCRVEKAVRSIDPVKLGKLSSDDPVYLSSVTGLSETSLEISN